VSGTAREHLGAARCARRAQASTASRTRVTTVDASNGFSMKSSAPLLIASTAIGISPTPDMMKIARGIAAR